MGRQPAGLLRTALQSEHHVLCVHPADPSPDVAYEASMLQADTGRVLLPLLPATLHPGLRRLAELARAEGAEPPRLVELECWAAGPLLLDADVEGHRPGLPWWDVLRLVGGEIAELAVQTEAEELLPDAPLLVTGRFVDGGLWQATYLPDQAETRWRLALVGRHGRVTLTFPDGWPGPSVLTYADAAGQARTENFEAFNPWAALAGVFEDAVAVPRSSAIARSPGRTSCALELDAAARRSVAYRRSSTLDYPEATEEASFKGTMTLVGCGLLWLSVMLLILSVWVPWLGWAILPVFAIFLLLQGLKWVVKPEGERSEPSGSSER